MLPVARMSFWGWFGTGVEGGERARQVRDERCDSRRNVSENWRVVLGEVEEGRQVVMPWRMRS